MFRVAMLALGATLTFGALAPQDASAQLSGRERSEAAKRGGVIVPQDRRDDRVYDRRDDRCYDDVYDTRRNDDDRYRSKDKNEKNARKDDRRDRADRRDDCDDDRY